MRTQLLCTFVFANYENRNDLYCTFNAQDNGYRGKNTISIHRKKETNTLYTVNALNEVIKDLNNGILDKTMILPWEAFENSFLLTDDNGYRRIDLVFFKRINF